MIEYHLGNFTFCVTQKEDSFPVKGTASLEELQGIIFERLCEDEIPTLPQGVDRLLAHYSIKLNLMRVEIEKRFSTPMIAMAYVCALQKVHEMLQQIAAEPEKTSELVALPDPVGDQQAFSVEKNPECDEVNIFINTHAIPLPEQAKRKLSLQIFNDQELKKKDEVKRTPIKELINFKDWSVHFASPKEEKWYENIYDVLTPGWPGQNPANRNLHLTLYDVFRKKKKEKALLRSLGLPPEEPNKFLTPKLGLEDNDGSQGCHPPSY